MSTAAQSVSLLMLLAAVGLSSVGLYGLQNRAHPGARGFSLSLFGAAAWSVVIAINIWPVHLLPAFVSMTLRNGLILVILLGWLLLVVEYVRREQVTLRPVPAFLVLVIPISTVVLTATNPLHYLAFGPETPTAVGGGPAIEWGPWHLVFMAYAFTISLYAAGLLFKDYWRSQGIHRRQLLSLLAGFGIGFVGINDYLITGAFEGVPAYVRISPFTFLVTAGLWGLAVFRHQLFDLAPISRRTVVETMPDPVIAVDGQETIIDANPAATAVFRPDGGLMGTALSDLCQDYPQVCEQYQNDGQESVVTIKPNGEPRHFSIRTEPVEAGRDASIIVFRDVTRLKSYEAQLEAQRDNLKTLNEVSRHDIRNDLNIVQGYTELLEREVDSDRGHDAIETIQESTESAIRLTRSIRDLTEAMVTTGPPDESVHLKRTVESQITALKTAYPEASVTITEPFPDVSVVGDELLTSVFRNVLENAIRHNDTVHPTVTVAADAGAESVTVRVADNGPGVPEDRKGEIFGKGAKGLESSGTGVGLYLVTTLVETYGGDVWVEDNDPRGAVFVVELPRPAD